MSLAYCSAQNSSQGSQPLLTRSCVSVEASRILLIMRAAYPAETPPCSWSFRSLQGHGVESAQLNAITSLATLFVTPSLRAQFVSRAPASSWLSAGLGYRLYEGSSVLQNAVANTEIHRNVATAQFGGESTSAPGSNCCSAIGFRGEFRDFYTLGNPSFGVPVLRSEQHNLVVSGGLVVHF
jgi:hypothetical protein